MFLKILSRGLKKSQHIFVIFRKSEHKKVTGTAERG